MINKFTKEKKNILFYTISLGGGGAQRQIVKIVKNISKQKYNIDIFIRDNDLRYKADLRADYNIIIHNKAPNRFGSLFGFISELVHLLFVVFKYKIDVIYSRGYPFYLKAFLIKIILFGKLKLISFDSNSFIHSVTYKSKYKEKLMYMLCKLALHNSDIVYCMTKENKNNLVRVLNLSIDKIFIFPVIFYLDEFKNIQNQSNSNLFDKKYFNVLSVGRFVRQKNHLFLIEAFEKLKDDNNLLHIYGEGELLSQYNNKIKQLQMEKEIKIHKFNTSIYKVITESDLVVFPSLFEGFGNVVIESILCGTPIISTNFSGMDEDLRVLLNNEGLIVELGDYTALSNKIIYVKQNYFHIKSKILEIKEILRIKYSSKEHVKLLECHIDKLYS